MALSRVFTALAEVLVMTAMLLSYIWGWKGAFPGHLLACAILYFTIGIWSHAWRGEKAVEIGFRLDNLAPALRNALWVVGPLLLIPLVFGAVLGSYHYPSPLQSAKVLAWGWFWGTAQQYGLLCFFYRRLSELLRDERWAMPVAGLLFALFHVPNPFLMAYTMVAGTLSCWLYRRHPNVFVLGSLHAIVAYVIHYSLPMWLTLGSKVGP